jgi:subtilisin-like proprotein convertase family protein
MNEMQVAMWKARAFALTLVAALLLGGLGPGTTGIDAAKHRGSARKFQQFQNSTPINIASNAQAGPSSITVSGFDTPIADVNVRLNLLTHPAAGDLDILLVGPSGQTALIMSEAGGPASSDSLIFDDQAASQVPNFPDPVVSGVFQPTNYDFTPSPDTFAAPAPTNPASGSALAVFNGTGANGTWTLFVKEQDNVPVETGSIASWGLDITTANGVPNAGPESFQAQTGQTLTVLATGVLQNDSDPDGDALTAVLAGQAAKGKVELLPDGSFTYRANKKAKGTDSFTYLAQDTTGLSDLETVKIQVKGKKKKKGKK